MGFYRLFLIKAFEMDINIHVHTKKRLMEIRIYILNLLRKRLRKNYGRLKPDQKFRMIRSPLKEFYEFLLRPELKRESYRRSTKIRKFFVLMALDIFIALFLLGIIFFLNYIKLTDTNNLKVSFGPGTKVLSQWVLIIVLFVLLVPLIEETIFRLHLRPGKRVLRIWFATVILIGVFFLVQKFQSTFCDLTVIAGGIALLTWYFRNQYKINNAVRRLWIRNFSFVFYFTTLVFGFYHLQNYRLSPSILLFSPLIVAPQIFLGLITGFLRTMLGFWWGYLSHVIHNTFFFMIPFLLFSTFSSPTGLKQECATVNFPPEVFPPEKYDLKIDDTENSRWHSGKINPREIETERTTIKRVFSILTFSDTANIKFENRELANTKINISFRDKSPKQHQNTSYIRYFVLQKLLDKYNLKAEREFIQDELWLLTVRDNSKLLKQKKQEGKNVSPDKIILKEVTLRDLSKKIKSTYHINVFCPVTDYEEYTFIIPENDLEELHELLNDYGLYMERKERKIAKFYISSKDSR